MCLVPLSLTDRLCSCRLFSTAFSFLESSSAGATTICGLVLMFAIGAKDVCSGTIEVRGAAIASSGSLGPAAAAASLLHPEQSLLFPVGPLGIVFLQFRHRMTANDALGLIGAGDFSSCAEATFEDCRGGGTKAVSVGCSSASTRGLTT